MSIRGSISLYKIGSYTKVSDLEVSGNPPRVEPREQGNHRA